MDIKKNDRRGEGFVLGVSITSPVAKGGNLRKRVKMIGF